MDLEKSAGPHADAEGPTWSFSGGLGGAFCADFSHNPTLERKQLHNNSRTLHQDFAPLRFVIHSNWLEQILF
jgi:hypothetical protein